MWLSVPPAFALALGPAHLLPRSRLLRSKWTAYLEGKSAPVRLIIRTALSIGVNSGSALLDQHGDTLLYAGSEDHLALGA